MVARALAVLSLGILSTAVVAGVIGLGLDWRKGVYVQEFWRGDVPVYAIANLSKDPVTISVHERKPGENLIAGPWVVRPKSTLTVDVPTVVGKDLMTFKLADGGGLGLMHGPPATTGPNGILASYEGLNGSGGRQKTLWIEQPKETVAPGSEFTLILKVPANSGLIKWSQKDEKNNALSQLGLIEAKSDTLPIEKKGDNIEIDTGKPTKAADVHAVTLKFRAPATTEPTMVFVSGWRAIPNGGGHGITRGVLVAPEKK